MFPVSCLFISFAYSIWWISPELICGSSSQILQMNLLADKYFLQRFQFVFCRGWGLGRGEIGSCCFLCSKILNLNCCSLMYIDKCIQVHNHSSIMLQNMPITPVRSFMLPPRQPLFDFYYHLLIQLRLRLHVKEIIQYACLASFAPHNILRFIYVVACISFFIADRFPLGYYE